MTARCPWCKDDELYCQYHDTEWGVPLSDDQQLFEFLSLESAQAGLSWITILRKRENYRAAYKQFDINKVARFNAANVEKLLANPGIVRNRAKIEASIHNAKLFINIQQQYGSFAEFYWRYVDGQPLQNKRRSLKEVPATTELSDTIARDFRKLGFKFLGSTTIYAFMQATGMVNDHIVSCHRYETCRELGQGFTV